MITTIIMVVFNATISYTHHKKRPMPSASAVLLDLANSLEVMLHSPAHTDTHTNTHTLLKPNTYTSQTHIKQSTSPAEAKHEHLFFIFRLIMQTLLSKL